MSSAVPNTSKSRAWHKSTRPVVRAVRPGPTNPDSLAQGYNHVNNKVCLPASGAHLEGKLPKPGQHPPGPPTSPRPLPAWVANSLIRGNEPTVKVLKV